MELFPAIDLRGGTAVRLVQGDFRRERSYGDPLELAHRFSAGGARWLHIVDLDAARTGTPVNRAVVLAIARAVDVPVQTGGGVRTVGDAEELLDGGVARVVVGTAAMSDPTILHELTERFPGQVAAGLDHRLGGGQVAVSGWERSSGVTLSEALRRLAEVPVSAVIVTAIERDGTLKGPDLNGLRAVLGLTEHAVIASGGVRSAGDVVALAGLSVGTRRLAGAIVGKALVDGELEVEEALAACARSG
jgi:phosphoribosylformimino-5-aminoimidazole carboxamide ribotide isomerase